MSEIIALRCDGEGCDVISMPWEAKVKNYRTARAQQTNRKERKHYCAEHYPYERCTFCKNKLRPYSGKAVDWPDTVAKAKSNPPMCMNCHQKGYDHIDTKANVDQDTAAAVRRLVVRHYQQHDEEGAWELPAQETLALLGLD